MDDIRIWDYARTYRQIKESMYRGVFIEPFGLISYWDFNQGAGSSVIDLINHNNGSIIGSPEWVLSSLQISPGWIEVIPESGLIDPKSTIYLTVDINAANLDCGYYSHEIIFNNNNPNLSDINIPISLYVQDAPSINPQEKSVSFGNVFLHHSKQQQLVIENNGSQDLLIFKTEIDESEFNIIPSFASVDPGDSETFTITFCPQSVGKAKNNILFSTNDPVYKLYELPVNGTGIEPPVISCNTDSISFNVEAGQIDSTTIQIQNKGKSDLIYQISSRGFGEEIIDTDFNQAFPSDVMKILGDAQHHPNSGDLYLTTASGGIGGIFTLKKIESDYLNVKFDFAIGGGSGADGFVLAFLVESTLGGGGCDLGFYNNSAKGWGIEFDTWENSNETENHIAVVLTNDPSNYYEGGQHLNTNNKL